MNFSTARKVVDTIRAGDNVERIRGLNRVKVNNAANGFPFVDPADAEKIGLKVNSNFMEFTLLLANALRQYMRSFMGGNLFFQVKIPTAPIEKQQDWEMFITQKLNRFLKKSKEFFFLQRNKFSGVVAHGIGPQMWWDKECILAKYVAIEDFRVPTDTQISFENLDWFAVRVPYTEGTLAKSVFGENADPHWNKKAIAPILKYYHKENWNDAGWNYSWLDAPEKMAEMVKQDGGFYCSDAVPTIPLWHFYFKDGKKWYMRVVPDWNVGADVSLANNDFLYTDEEPIADDLAHLLFVQFGDLSEKTPHLVYSIRSLGFLLLEPCFWNNTLRCRTVQHLMESFNVWFRVNDPAGRARAQKIEMYDKAIIPEGVSVVPNTERHQVNEVLINNVMSGMRQLMSEASASYTQESDSGTQKEQTAFETQVKMAMVNALMEGLILFAMFQESQHYEEICRRFCLRKSTADEAKKFQQECKDHGIPDVFVNVELWDVEPAMPMGAGNPAMAFAQAKQLLEMRPMFGATGQQEILHEAAAVFTNDPRKADRWAPIDQRSHVSDGVTAAEYAFGTLMQGVPVRLKEGLSLIDQIETFLGLFAGVITQIEQTGNMATMWHVIGLQTVQAKIAELIGELSGNKDEKPRVKEYADALGKLSNAVKGFQQRLAEQQGQQQEGGDNGAVQAKLIMAQTNAKVKELSSQQKFVHTQQKFEAEEQRKNAAAVAEIGRQGMKARAEVENAPTATE